MKILLSIRAALTVLLLVHAVIGATSAAVARERAESGSPPGRRDIDLSGVIETVHRNIRAAAVVGDEIPVSGPVFGPSPGNRSLSGIAWNGTIYLAVWVDLVGGRRAGMLATRIDAQGHILDPTGITLAWFGAPTAAQSLVSLSTAHTSVAWDGENFLVAWSENRTSNPFGLDAYAVHVSPEGQVGSLLRLTDGDATEGVPAVACGPDDCLLAWQTEAGDGNRIYATRLSSSGEQLDKPPLLLSGSSTADLNPAVAWSGTEYLVVWNREGAGVHATVVLPDGEVPEPEGHRVGFTSQGNSPSVAPGANGAFFVSWYEGSSSGPSSTERASTRRARRSIRLPSRSPPRRRRGEIFLRSRGTAAPTSSCGRTRRREPRT
jgi:hypothetical protein